MKNTSASSKADAEAGYTPPSKTGSSAKELPGPSTANTCSRPDGDNLKIRILPVATTNRPWHGSPSLNSVSPRPKCLLLTRAHNVRISLSVNLANSRVFRSTASLVSGPMCLNSVPQIILQSAYPCREERLFVRLGAQFWHIVSTPGALAPHLTTVLKKKSKDIKL